jgi:hypothetical protein
MEYTEKLKGITSKSLGIEINPNVFFHFSSDVNPETVTKDEELVKEISLFLWDHVLPMITKQIREGEFFPRDCNSMISYLHRMGINIRYCGQLAKLAIEQEKEDSDLFLQGRQRVHSMPFYWLEFLIIEMIARSVKYLLNKKLRDNLNLSSSPALTIASLLNHVLSILANDEAGTAATAGENQQQKKGEKLGVKNPSDTQGLQKKESSASVTATTEGEKSKNKKKKKTTSGTSSSTGNKEGEEGFEGVTGPISSSLLSFDNESYNNGFSDRMNCLTDLSTILMERFLYDFTLLSDLINSSSSSSSTTVVTSGSDEEKSANETRTATNSFLKSRLSPTMLIHRICQQCGIVILSKNYNLRNSNPFTVDDIIGLIPKMKSCEPDTYLPEFTDILNTSTQFLHQGNSVAAFEYAQQAVNIINQVMSCFSSFSVCFLRFPSFFVFPSVRFSSFCLIVLSLVPLLDYWTNSFTCISSN